MAQSRNLGISVGLAFALCAALGLAFYLLRDDSPALPDPDAFAHRPRLSVRQRPEGARLRVAWPGQRAASPISSSRAP